MAPTRQPWNKVAPQAQAEEAEEAHASEDQQHVEEDPIALSCALRCRCLDRCSGGPAGGCSGYNTGSSRRRTDAGPRIPGNYFCSHVPPPSLCSRFRKPSWVSSCRLCTLERCSTAWHQHIAPRWPQDAPSYQDSPKMGPRCPQNAHKTLQEHPR